MRKMHSKKGMTLVELIIAVAFTAIVIAAACTVLYLGGNFFKSGTANAASQQKATLAESYLQRYASTAFQLSDKDVGSAGVAFTLSDGVLHMNQRTAAGSSVKTNIDGISQVNLTIKGKLLTYSIVSKDAAYTLTGGIVTNNYSDSTADGIKVDLNGVNSSCLFLGSTAP